MDAIGVLLPKEPAHPHFSIESRHDGVALDRMSKAITIAFSIRTVGTVACLLALLHPENGYEGVCER
jgi:hypothetical protein